MPGRVGVPHLDGGGDGVHQGVQVGGEQALRSPAFGDVHHHDAHPDDLGVDAHRVEAAQTVVGPARYGRVGPGDLHVEHGLPRGEHRPVDRFQLGPQVGGDLGCRPADLVLDRQTGEPGQGLVDPELAELAVYERQAHRRRRLQGVQQRHAGGKFSLGPAQAPLLALLVVDVGDGADPRQDGAVRPAHRRAA